MPSKRTQRGRSTAQIPGRTPVRVPASPSINLCPQSSLLPAQVPPLALDVGRIEPEPLSVSWPHWDCCGFSDLPTLIFENNKRTVPSSDAIAADDGLFGVDPVVTDLSRSEVPLARRSLQEGSSDRTSDLAQEVAGTVQQPSLIPPESSPLPRPAPPDIESRFGVHNSNTGEGSFSSNSGAGTQFNNFGSGQLNNIGRDMINTYNHYGNSEV
ncbi:hypothetical protein HGRIS_010611 [Hohenbuehelia grisea]|uniref:Uncharacterized protein n=1 Tax=Hohenbuehelia grisea TaxID=104357 RepID=A0ABR3IXD3_9AGAR